MSSGPVLIAEGLGHAFAGRGTLFSGLNLTLCPGERLALVGPSGCGKTTLLRLMDGSVSVQEGAIRAEGQVAMVYQDERLVPQATVLENVCHGAPGWLLRPSDAVRERAQGLINELGIGGIAGSRVGCLSGGQRKRVALARALMSEPKVLLADEPLAGLEDQSAGQVARLMQRLQLKHGFALVCATHAPQRFGAEFFDRTLRMDALPGCGACDVSCAIGEALRPEKGAGRNRRVPMDALWAMVVALLVVWSLWSVFRDAPGVGEMVGSVGALLVRFWPEGGNWGILPWDSLGRALVQTVQMALAGTALGAVLSLPLAFGATAARPGSPVEVVLRVLLTGIRTVPALIWALLTVAAVGIGPAAGVLALAAYSMGYLTRFYSEELENADARSAEALRRLGAGRVAALWQAQWPAARPGLLGASFFCFEYNVRAASILGVVGAGGIGTQLAYALEWRAFPTVFAGLLMLLAVVLPLDWASRRWRRVLGQQRGV